MLLFSLVGVASFTFVVHSPPITHACVMLSAIKRYHSFACCRHVDRPAEEGANEEDVDVDLSRATGIDDDKKSSAISKLSKVVQLSGFSDPVYVEAYVNVNQYDISLDGMQYTRVAFTCIFLLIDYVRCDGHYPRRTLDPPFTSTLCLVGCCCFTFLIPKSKCICCFVFLLRSVGR
jgi:hypothetical protein